jgi:hypothetical protein
VVGGSVPRDTTSASHPYGVIISQLKKSRNSEYPLALIEIQGKSADLH